ncbi:MAG: hypothetical protein QOG63_2407 [Thermoleophilaceae bacterium]|nr:hypothetical protein [Thermoleophilaceae bacterium]
MELRSQRAAAVVLALLAAVLCAAGTAQAQDLNLAASQTKPPSGYRLNAHQAIAIADRDPKVLAERPKHHEFRAYAYDKGAVKQWQVSYFGGGKELAQLTIDDATGAVLESWTGPQVAWKMARGYEGAFGSKVNAPYIWLPLCALFIAPFVYLRRPFRLLHFDLLVLLAFGASHVFFNRGEIDVSVPLAYPVLVYLLARLLWEGSRRSRAAGRGPLIPYARPIWLAMALIFLVGFRIALNIADANVIDVGYAGVIGADRITHGHGLYAGDFPKDNEHGDTYGPVDYLVYVPFEQAFPWDGKWSDLPAAHAAAIFFDLVTLLGLLVLGRRLRAGPAGRDLGVVLAYAWAAYPYTLYALNSNSNDTLVAAALVWALVALRSPPARGVFVALGAAAKFVPLALAPLFATASHERRGRGALVFSVVLAVVVVAAFAPFVPHGGVRQIWDQTLGYQLGRESPFSIWGQHAGLAPLWTAVKVAAGLLALAVAFVPRRKTPVQVAALGAAVLVALQIAASHWFYLYVVWFAPLAFVAFMCRHVPERAPPAPVRTPEREPELAVA